MDLSYIINQLGEDRAKYENAVVPPIYQTAQFVHDTVADMRAHVADEFANHVYTRGNNPTTEILRAKLAALEGAESALVFGSGAAAMAAGVLASVRAGDHVVSVAKPYSWTKTLLRKFLPRFGVAVDFVDATDTQAVEDALRRESKLIVLESPNSLTYEQQDLAAIAKLAQARGVRTICDNSYATPLGQSPIALGIDLVAHSGTKYLNGHSDVLVGVLCGSEALMREVFAGPFMTLGAILAPHDAWLVLRGLRTFPARMAQVAETTSHVVAFLAKQPKVRRLYYPQHATYEQGALTRTQLKAGNGLLSIELDCDLAGVDRFCDALQRFEMAASWGGYESLCFPVAGVRDWRGYENQATVPVTLVRLSIGLESADVLIADFAQALAHV